MTICFTSEKANNLIHCCEELLRLKSFFIRAFAQIVGKMVASQPGLFHAPLFSEKNKQLQVN